MIDFGPPLVVPELTYSKEEFSSGCALGCLHTQPHSDSTAFVGIANLGAVIFNVDTSEAACRGGLQTWRACFAVKTFLDAPLLSAPDVRHLVALCATADTLIERVTRLKNVESFDVSLLQEIEATCQNLFPSMKPQETLQMLGLLDMFPYLTQGLVVGKLELVSDNPGASYLTYVSLMNQVVIMGTQIYHDACVTQHHKYAAHQMALLYQCLNMLQGETKPIRRVIEARFDEIKQITESKQPVFELEMSDWEEIKACPPYIHKRLDPMMKVIKHS